MALILCIETATETCSVCLSENGQPITIQETAKNNSHSTLITKLIEGLFFDGKFSFNDLDAIALSKGPGSYTGLRIGASVAKGLCYALNKPLIVIPTLKTMAWGCVNKMKDDGLLFCPMINARRMEVFTAIYNYHLDEILAPQPMIIDDLSFKDFLSTNKMVFFGNGYKKCMNIIHSKNALFLSSFSNSSTNLCLLAFKSFQQNDFTELTYFEPSYFKKFFLG